MYDTLTDAQFKQLYDKAVADRAAGYKVTKWDAGDTGFERELTLNLADPNTWAGLAAEFRLRWPDKVRRRRRTSAVGRFY
jgi:hypothetical protein